jgi:hypothetical protein
MASFSKKLLTGFLCDSINIRPINIIRLFETPLQEVKVVKPNYDTPTIININSYTIEEQLVMYPNVSVHQSPECSNTIIDVE